MYVVSLVSRLPMHIVEETVTYGWPQGTSPYLVVTIYSKRPPCLNFAVHTGYMLPRRLCRLDALLLLINCKLLPVIFNLPTDPSWMGDWPLNKVLGALAYGKVLGMRPQASNQYGDGHV